MKLRRAFALALIAALFVPLARVARAEDPRDAAAAAIAASVSGAPKAAAPAPAAAQPKKKEGKPRKKSSASKKKPEAESKYKSRALSESGSSQYRFDENGNPIVGAAKKKPAAKTSKKSSDDSADKPACTDDAPCSDKKTSDADAL